MRSDNAGQGSSPCLLRGKSRDRFCIALPVLPLKNIYVLEIGAAHAERTQRTELLVLILGSEALGIWYTLGIFLLHQLPLTVVSTHGRALGSALPCHPLQVSLEP